MNNDEHLENEYENVEDEQVVNETDNGLNKIVNSEEDIADWTKEFLTPGKVFTCKKIPKWKECEVLYYFYTVAKMLLFDFIFLFQAFLSMSLRLLIRFHD